MINLTDGQINIGDKNILTASDKDLCTLTEAGLIERREIGGGKTYYYLEDKAGDMKFGISVRVREKKIVWLRLHWLDSPMKGWDDVSEERVKDEFRLLLNLVKNFTKRPPDIAKNTERTWRFNWGQVDVSFNLRTFQADIYMVPR